MKLRNFLFGAMASLAVLVGCTPNEDGQGEGGLFITVNNKSSVTFEAPAEGGSATYEVNAGEDWFSEINLPEGAQEWVSVNPPTGKAGKTTVTVTALPNTGFNREQDVKFSIGMKHAWLKVKQAGAKGDAAATVILSNDFTKDGVLVDKSNFGGSNPYLDKTDMWENWSGSGVADITYTSKSVDVRLLSKSTVNCLWFPKNKNAYLALHGIALNGAQNIKLSLAAVKNTPGDYKKDFVESEFKIWVSNDAAKWLDLDYTVTVDADGDYDNLSAVFAVPADTETLSLAFENLATDDGYRLDQIDMTVSEETPTVTLDFTAAVEKDFSSTGGGSTEPSTPVEIAKSIESGNYWVMNAEKTKAVYPIESGSYGYWKLTDAQDGKSTADNAFTFTWVDGKGYTIKDSKGMFHFMDASHNSFNISTSEQSDGSHYWAVSANQDGTYAIVNTVTGKTVQYSTQYGNYSPYTEVTGALPTLVAANDPVEGGDQGGDTPEPEQPTVMTLPYSETFNADKGAFSVDTKSKDAAFTGDVWFHAVYDGVGYMKASAYMNKTKYASEAWLVSPILDLTSETKATLTFEHAGKNFADVNTMKEQISLWAKTENGDWTELEIQGWPDNASYDYVSGGTFDLASYCGGKMQFAFKYTSTSGSAGTWQVRNVSVTNGAGDSGSEGGDQGGSEGGEDGGDDPVVTPPATGSGYVKVTSEPTDWSGKYLIVGENGGKSYAFNGQDAVNGYVEVTVSSETIAADASLDACVVEIAAVSGGYSLKVSNGYMSGTNNANKLNFGTTAVANTLTFEADGVKIESNTSVFRFNSTSSQMRFRYFKESTYTSQKPVQLYKLAE